MSMLDTVDAQLSGSAQIPTPKGVEKLAQKHCVPFQQVGLRITGNWQKPRVTEQHVP